MILHFIFLKKEEESDKHQFEFEYIQKMAQFFKIWIKEKFDRDYEVQCDEMVVKPSNLFRRIDTHTLIRDHEARGKDVYHFYLANFRPLWTDCTCEGYYAENFGMITWQSLKDSDDSLFLAEKNCTTVSHEILHEMLRLAGRKKHHQEVHELWTKHLFNQLEFEQYDENFKLTNEKPMFLTVDTKELKND